MPGEHYCTFCEEDQSKHKGTYAKLSYTNFYDDKKFLINVFCPKCREKDTDVDKGLTVLEEIAKPVESFKGAPKCSFCSERITKKEKSLRAEFRYNGTELRANVCEKCYEGDYSILKGISIKKPNPTFEVTLVCASTEKCESFKKPKRPRGINCMNICVNIKGELYCKKAHPGSMKVYRERWALPPSRKKLLELSTAMAPFLEKYKDVEMLDGLIVDLLESKRARLRELQDMSDEDLLQGGLTLPQAYPTIPENIEYTLDAIPLVDGKFTVPWGATPLGTIKDPYGPGFKLECLVPIKEKET